MNKNGFTLVEMLACLGLLGIVLCLGLIVNRGTLSTSMTQLEKISDNEVYDAVREYVLERKVTWIDETYTCVMVRELADYGYFDYNEISDISDNIIKLTRNSNTLVIDSVKYVDICE